MNVSERHDVPISVPDRGTEAEGEEPDVADAPITSERANSTFEDIRRNAADRHQSFLIRAARLWAEN